MERAPPANEAFSKAEMERRIEKLTAKYATAAPCGLVCWCCGVDAPRPSHVSAVGWAVRTVMLSGGNARETYCPQCFAEWGWPETQENDE